MAPPAIASIEAKPIEYIATPLKDFKVIPQSPLLYIPGTQEHTEAKQLAVYTALFPLMYCVETMTSMSNSRYIGNVGVGSSLYSQTLSHFDKDAFDVDCVLYATPGDIYSFFVAVDVS